MNWQQAIEKTVTGLGYELVDCELVSHGLLCVYIDRIAGRSYDELASMPEGDVASVVAAEGAPEVVIADVSPAPGGDAVLDAVSHVTVEDCERVNRQLQFVLEVEGVSYERLEVSSPGVDRPLRRPEHFVRFDGAVVDVTLKMIFQGRKRYRGVLRAAPDAARFELVFNDGKEDQVLGFTFAEVRDARLVPVLDFKGRPSGKPSLSGPAALKNKRTRSNAKAKQVGPESGGHEE